MPELFVDNVKMRPYIRLFSNGVTIVEIVRCARSVCPPDSGKPSW
jgi:hypothetical protein